MNPAWRKTQKGRVVYNDKASPFSPKDAARVLRAVLDFDIHLDDDAQTRRLFHFLFNHGFLPINLTFTEVDIKREKPAWFVLAEGLVNGIADYIGVPEPLQTFAQALGVELQNMVDPLGKAYRLNYDLIDLIMEEKDLVEMTGGGTLWQTEQRKRSTGSRT